MSDTMSVESFDDEDGPTPIQQFEATYQNYKFYLGIHQFETDSCFELIGKLKNGKEEIGNLEGYLVKRCWRNNFYEDCDSVSADMQLVSNVFFHKSGAPRKNKWRAHLTNDEIEECRMGGFLFIEKVFVEKAFRGNDLAFHFLKFTFESLKDQWNLSVVEPGYYYDDAGNDKIDMETRNKNIVVLFQRMGFSELDSVRNSLYLYVIPKKLAYHTKQRFKIEDVNIPVDDDRSKKTDVKVKNFISEMEATKDKKKLKAEFRDFQEKNPEMDMSSCGILHMAANQSSLTSLLEVMLLPEFGLDPNAINVIGDTPLHAAARAENVNAIKILFNHPDIDLFKKCKYGRIPYETLISHIDSMSCFLQAMDIDPKSENVCESYEMAFKIMPPQIKKHFVENVLSKRMFVRFRITAEVQNDFLKDMMRYHNFVRGQRESIEDLDDLSLFVSSMPEDVVEGGVYKTFVAGFSQILEEISIIMGKNQLPTQSRVLSSISVRWPPNFKYFLENGGKVEYVYKGLFDRMFISSYSNGDNDFEDTFIDDLEDEPEVEFFDTDFQYLNTFVFQYLLNN